MEQYKRIEKSIITTYRAHIWKKFVSAVNEYELIRDNDRIAVCISGGKDSMLLAKCMQELQKHGKKNYEVEFLVMDPGYSPENRKAIEHNAALLNVPIKIYESNIFDVVDNVGGSPCYLCARMRRGFLYARAKEMGCNKIALGHHFNDVIETILMGLFYNGQYQSMRPKLKSDNFEGMELIRPLYKVAEKDIINWSVYNNLKFLRCACRLTKENEEGNGDSKRAEMKELVKELKKSNPNIDISIFKSMYNVNVDTAISYKKGDEKFNFLDEYMGRSD